MLRSLFTSATGMAAQQMNLDVVANNLANASTTGFKRSRADFKDLLYEAPAAPGAQTGGGTVLPTGTQIGLGVATGTTTTINNQGTVINTGNKYDLAIKGEGYFRVQLPTGDMAYSRAGGFNIDGTGRLVTSEGYPIQPEIIVPPNNTGVTISPNGEVSVTMPGQAEPQKPGRLQLSTFVNPAGLRAMGGNLFSPTAASGQPVDAAPGEGGAGTLLQASLEGSNVDVVEEMVRMIIIQRAYDTNSKVIKAADDMLNTTNQIA